MRRVLNEVEGLLERKKIKKKKKKKETEKTLFILIDVPINTLE